jgi:hypothetical protein
MSKSANKAAKVSPKVAAATATRAKAARKAPGNAKALEAKAADNLAKVQARKGRAECIMSAVQAQTGNGLVVTTSRDRSIVIVRVDREVNRLAKIGEPVAPLEAYLKNQPKPIAKLAQGVEGKMTENSRKAVADQKAAAAPKAAAPKAGKNKQPSAGTNRAYTLGKRKIEAKPDSWRGYMLATIVAAKDTDSAKAKHAKSGKFSDKKLDLNWAAAQDYIRFAK